MRNARLLIITSSREGRRVYDTETGEIDKVSRLPELISYGDGFLVGANLYQDVARLQKAYADVPGWVCRIQVMNKTVFRGPKRQTTGHMLPSYVGFRDPSRNGATRRWNCMELTELLHGAHSLSFQSVHDMSRALLSILDERGVKTWSPSKGALARRILKASPEWDNLTRHPAPQHINELARPLMPGNHYAMSVEPMTSIRRAIYLDQISAHHTIAREIDVPEPGGMRARGNHRELAEGRLKPWVHKGSRSYAAIQETHIGLVAGLVSFPGHSSKHSHLRPPWADKTGTHLTYWYTNEWPELDAMGATVSYLCAAWTSLKPDPVIKEYAQWATEALARHKEHKAILKQTLLAGYGVLATRSDSPSVSLWGGVSIGRTGVVTNAPQAGPMVERSAPVSRAQPRMVNVIARGMIEAETRRRSLLYARVLEGLGHRVLCIYVDGLIVEGDTVPIPPKGWAVETHLTDLLLRHPNQYEARERVRLPGISLTEERRRRSARAPLGVVHSVDRAGNILATQSGDDPGEGSK